MVNAPQLLRERRTRAIAEIMASLNEGIKNGVKPDYDKLLIATMANLGISKQTAKEYVEVALFNVGIEIEKK